jgi:hypothetical protein
VTIPSLEMPGKGVTDDSVVVGGPETTTLLLVNPEVIMIFTSGHFSLPLVVKFPLVVIKMLGQFDGCRDD